MYKLGVTLSIKLIMSQCRVALRVAGWQNTDSVADVTVLLRLPKNHGRCSVCVTRFWKNIEQNFTLGLFCFIGPANRYTHTL